MKSYAQMCPLALGLDRIGERWTLLIVREMLIRRDLRFKDLQDGLPGIATNLLTSRLDDLLELGLVERSFVGHSKSQPVYNLSKDGHELAPAILAIAKWGAKFSDRKNKNYEQREHWDEFSKKNKIVA